MVPGREAPGACQDGDVRRADAIPLRRLEAYRRTLYRVRIGASRTIEIRVGRRTAELDRLLFDAGKRRWAFLTACNPGARRLGPSENGSRTRALRRALRAGRHMCFPGTGGADSGGWEEESFLVLGIALRDAERLRRRFRQDAFVTGIRGGRARLASG